MGYACEASQTTSSHLGGTIRGNSYLYGGGGGNTSLWQPQTARSGFRLDVPVHR
jgi:hypothetical protein